MTGMPLPQDELEAQHEGNRASADQAVGNHSALGAVSPRRRLLDHKAPLGKEHLECGVVEVAAISTPDRCGNRLEPFPFRRTE